jgi:cytochrome c-type biogenesis protein CcmH
MVSRARGETAFRHGLGGVDADLHQDGGRVAVTFWLAAGVLALAVAVLLVVSAMSRGTAGDATVPERRIHADQLREIERDALRGVIAPDEAARMRAEVARRLIDSARPGALAAAVTRGPAGIAAVIAAVLVLGGGAFLYRDLGAPGYPDLPMSMRLAEAQALRDARPAQAEAEAAIPPVPPPPVDADFLALMDKLRAGVAGRPDDLQGHTLLVENEARLGRHAAAARAQADVIRIKGAYVTPEDQILLARLMIAAAGGAISPEAEAALDAGLTLNPDSDEALFLIGLSHLRTGRPDLGFAAWAHLIATAPGGSEWLDAARARIGDVAAAAGVEYALPDDLALPGPAAEDVEASADMTPEARDAMVRGMVERLAERLATTGGSAAEWARLVTALATLGEIDRARAIRDEAKGVFAGRADDLAVVGASARAAGIGE